MTNPVEAIRAAVAAMNGGDLDGYLSNFDPSCPRWLSGVDQPLSLADVADGLRQMCGAFDPLHLDEESLFGDDRFACARWRLRGTHIGDFMGVAASGASVSVQMCEIYEFAGDRVVTSWVYADHGELFRQMAAGAQ